MSKVHNKLTDTERLTCVLFHSIARLLLTYLSQHRTLASQICVIISCILTFLRVLSIYKQKKEITFDKCNMLLKKPQCLTHVVGHIKLLLNLALIKILILPHQTNMNLLPMKGNFFFFFNPKQQHIILKDCTKGFSIFISFHHSAIYFFMWIRLIRMYYLFVVILRKRVF